MLDRDPIGQCHAKCTVQFLQKSYDNQVHGEIDWPLFSIAVKHGAACVRVHVRTRVCEEGMARGWGWGWGWGGMKGSYRPHAASHSHPTHTCSFFLVAVAVPQVITTLDSYVSYISPAMNGGSTDNGSIVKLDIPNKFS